MNMKKMRFIALCVIAGLLMIGCGGSRKKEMTVGTDISAEDITDFYYTYENINYNASYQRYRVYVEDGRHMFFHETRERKDDYGPTTEADATKKGEFELSDEEWAEIFELLKDGTVKQREESFEGDTGPWLYLYWKNDNSVYQQYSFKSWGTQKAFEEFCAELAAEER